MNDAIELDEHARELFETYRAAVEAIASFDEARVKSRDQLMDWFAMRAAHRGSIDGEHVVTYVDTERTSFDTRQFRLDQPALHAAYSKRVPVRSLRLP